MKKAALHNLGCKVNAYETEAMQQLLEQAGYEIVPFREGADVYVINTCTVTNVADKKSRQMLHRARKMNPDAVVVAAGCYVQAKGEEADSCIDILIGNNQKHQLIALLAEYQEGKHTCGLLDIGKETDYEELTRERTTGHTRAYIKVQDGCNQFCTYCIIPYARGRVRSRKQEDVIREVQALADAGYQEVVLTGIHLSSYGVDTKESLLELIHLVHGVEGMKRIRLGSLEPLIITEEFVKAVALLPKLCPHFHLSLQSGCNATLKRMNRRYTAEEYEQKCRLLREYFYRPALTTDIIVGFPGETEEEFEESEAFIDRLDFYETHVFKYSRREGTKAAQMEGQVAETVKALRSERLIALGKQKQEAYERCLIGTSVEVLVEEAVRIKGELYQVGHTKEYVKIGKKTTENLVNQIICIDVENGLQIIH